MYLIKMEPVTHFEQIGSKRLWKKESLNKITRDFIFLTKITSKHCHIEFDTKLK